MMNKDNDDKLNSNIRQSLDESVDNLDANTLSQIRQIRAQAVDKVIDNSEKSHINWLPVMTGALATACVMVFAVMILLKSPTPMQILPVDDIELISSSENLELFEDLEFYEWLDEYELSG